MGKFNEYTQKATPADNDTMMIYDAAAKANKLSPFSGIWNWIVGKLTNAVISNLQTRNRTVVGALNEINNGLPVCGIYDLDNPPKKMIFSAMAGSTNLPNGLGGANAVTVIQMNLGDGNFDSMIAFTFAVDKIAIRRKNGTKNWSEWKYFNTAEILSNLTTTNKSSLVGAINELNSNRLFDIYRNYSWKTSHSIDISKANTLLMIAFGGSNGDQSIVLPLTKTGTDTWLYNAEYLATTNFAISCKSNVLTITNTATFLCFLVKVI